MTPKEIKTELEHHIVHSRNLGHMPTTEKQLLGNILANQVLIMESQSYLIGNAIEDKTILLKAIIRQTLRTCDELSATSLDRYCERVIETVLP